MFLHLQTAVLRGKEGGGGGAGIDIPCTLTFGINSEMESHPTIMSRVCHAKTADQHDMYSL